MLTQLTTLKLRLGLLDTDNTNDALLTALLEALHARFDNECARSFARSVDATEEFDAAQTEILVAAYPIEQVTKFEIKSSEAAGWQEIQPPPDFLIRSRCLISLATPLNLHPAPCNLQLARATYTGGYVLPGDPDPQPLAPERSDVPTSRETINHQPIRLPSDLEQATVDQAAFWFDNRARLGLSRLWEYHGTYRQFAALDLLPGAAAVLGKYRRMLL